MARSMSSRKAWVATRVGTRLSSQQTVAGQGQEHQPTDFSGVMDLMAVFRKGRWPRALPVANVLGEKLLNHSTLLAKHRHHIHNHSHRG